MGFSVNAIGEARQHSPETASCTLATLALPKRVEKYPPMAHPKKPMAIMMNDQSGIFECSASMDRVCRQPYGQEGPERIQFPHMPEVPEGRGAEARHLKRSP